MKRLELRVEDVQSRAWVEKAACRGLDNATRDRLFFPESGNMEKEGLKICLGTRSRGKRTGKPACPVKDYCLEYALSLPPRETVGIWGGTTSTQRRAILYQREAAKHKIGA